MLWQSIGKIEQFTNKNDAIKYRLIHKEYKIKLKQSNDIQIDENQERYIYENEQIFDNWKTFDFTNGINLLLNDYLLPIIEFDNMN